MDRRRGYLAAAVLLLSIPAIWFWMTEIASFPGDSAATRIWRQRDIPAEIGSLTRFFADLASPLVAVPTVAITAVLVGRRTGRRDALLVVASFVVVPIGDAIQVWAGPSPPMREARPFNSLDNFPSVHVAYATAVFGTVALIARRHGKSDVALVLIGLIVLMAPARIVAGAHTVSDVVAGFALGGAWLALAATMAGTAERRERGRPLGDAPFWTPTSRPSPRPESAGNLLPPTGGPTAPRHPE